ncbi:MAG: hypothetical protein D6753_13690 [Planctomycetota bacterium]|nr:MAG: hypothetical protein D6753_13690 [Planctomycetota bacterium]
MLRKHLFEELIWGGLAALLVWGGWTSRPGWAQAPESAPLRVFILAGQSNMQGHAQVSTIPAMQWNPQAAPLLKDILGPDGQPRACQRVWISSLGSSDTEKIGRLTVGFGAAGKEPKIGPEYTFGIYIEKHLDGPVLIIKTAWGGKSLHTDFRPPSAGPYEFTPEQLEVLERRGKDVQQIQADRKAASGRFYRLMIDHVRFVLSDIERVCPQYDPAQGYELAGFVWFQGWNDMVDSGTYPHRDQPKGFDEYSRLLGHFIRDVRSDLDCPDLPFVIGVLGVGGPTDRYGPDKQRYKSVHQNFRDAMAAPADWPEFRGNVVAVRTEAYWDMQVAALRERERAILPQVNAIRKRIRAGEIARDEGEQQIAALYDQTFDARELEILRRSVSNAEYHYLGSAGIMAQIGKGFADAMVQLMEKRSPR